MKTAIITSKEYQTGTIINEGEAILLNCLDRCQERSFWELRFIKDQSTTHCRWVQNDLIDEIAE